MRKRQDLISIVLTLYNKAHYIEETIFSIYKQTYVNWELIIIDDCSTDGSFEIAKSFCKKLGITNKCNFIKNEKNLRVAKTFERGLRKAKGDWISMCDGDDILIKNKLEENLSYCKKNNIDFCHSDLTTIDENNNIINISWVKKNRINTDHTGFYDILFRNVCTGSAIFFSKSIGDKIINNGGFCPAIYQDRWASIFASISDIKIGYINTPLVLYRRCDSCITSDKNIGDNNQILNSWNKYILREINACNYILKNLNIDATKKKRIKNNIKCNEYLINFLNSDKFILQPKILIKILKIKSDLNFLYRIFIIQFRKFISKI